LGPAASRDWQLPEVRSDERIPPRNHPWRVFPTSRSSRSLGQIQAAETGSPDATAQDGGKLSSSPGGCRETSSPSQSQRANQHLRLVTIAFLVLKNNELCSARPDSMPRKFTSLRVVPQGQKTQWTGAAGKPGLAEFYRAAELPPVPRPDQLPQGRTANAGRPQTPAVCDRPLTAASNATQRSTSLAHIHDSEVRPPYGAANVSFLLDMPNSGVPTIDALNRTERLGTIRWRDPGIEPQGAIVHLKIAPQILRAADGERPGADLRQGAQIVLGASRGRIDGHILRGVELEYERNDRGRKRRKQIDRLWSRGDRKRNRLRGTGQAVVVQDGLPQGSRAAAVHVGHGQRQQPPRLKRLENASPQQTPRLAQRTRLNSPSRWIPAVQLNISTKLHHLLRPLHVRAQDRTNVIEASWRRVKGLSATTEQTPPRSQAASCAR
jgi:hypothetical protein